MVNVGWLAVRVVSRRSAFDADIRTEWTKLDAAVFWSWELRGSAYGAMFIVKWRNVGKSG